MTCSLSEDPCRASASGDLIVVPETGGYYFSSHFSYNALARPAVYAVFTDETGQRQWSLVRRAQNTAEIVAEAGEHDFAPLTS